MLENQREVTNEEAEREFVEAEETFKEELGVEEPTGEETAKRNQQIITALGFKKYEDGGVIKYSIRVMDIKIGVTFNETNPLGKVWAYKIPEGDEDKEFLKNGDLKQHPLILKYYAIQEGKEPIPEVSVTGKITEKRGKAIKVKIEENGENKEIFFGQGAVKKDNDGYFIPAGFSKATKDHDAKMDMPRNIRLSDYETEMKQILETDKTKEEEPKERAEKGTVADKIPHKELESREERIANTMQIYLEKGREMVEQIFPELEQPQLSELSQDIATSMFIEDRKEARKERW